MVDQIEFGRGLSPEALSKVQDGTQKIMDFCKGARIGSTKLVALLDVRNYYHAESELLSASAAVGDLPKGDVAPMPRLVVARVNRDAILRDIERSRTASGRYNRDYIKVSEGADLINEGYDIREGGRTSFHHTSAVLTTILTRSRGFEMITAQVYFTG